jgi:two-component system, OmpR family, KDP operon response regulator KdpE
MLPDPAVQPRAAGGYFLLHRAPGRAMTNNAISVLIVDDELPIRRLLKRKLAAQSYRVVEAETAKRGLDAVRSDRPDVVILDLGLPDLDGIEVISLIRAVSKVPVVVLSSRSDERTKVEALLRGADDYVTKPFGMDELVARLQTALRHGFHEQGQEPVFRTGELMVDLVHRKISVGGEEVRLSPTEFDLLRLLVTHAGRVLTHRQILREIRGQSADDDVQYLRVYMRLLRRKLEPDPVQPRYIITEPGVGYRLQVAE